MQVRTDDSILTALEKVKIPDEAKEDYSLVGSRLAALFNNFNNQGKIALVKKDSDIEDEDFAFELSRQMITAIKSKDGYDAVYKALAALHKSGSLKLSPTLMDADYLKTTVTPAIYLAIQFPQVDISNFYSSIKNAVNEIMSALNKGRTVALSKTELFNKLFTECYSGEARDLTALKAELINKGHRAFPINPVFEFGPKKEATKSPNPATFFRAGLKQEKEAYAAAFIKLFQAGGPLSHFSLSVIPDITASFALNALNVMIEELEKPFNKGYVAFLDELLRHTAKYFSPAPNEESIQNEIGPWLYLAFRYPDKIKNQWKDLAGLAAALKQARIQFGALPALDEAVHSSLGPDNLTANSSALTALLKKPATKTGASSAVEEEEDGISDEELDKLLLASGLDPATILGTMTDKIQATKTRLIHLKNQKYCPLDEFEKAEKQEIENLKQEIASLVSRTSSLPTEIKDSYSALLAQLKLLDQFEDRAGYAHYQTAEKLHQEISTIQKNMSQFLAKLPQFHSFVETLDSLTLKIQELQSEAARLKAEQEAQPLEFETKNKAAIEKINKKILEIQKQTKTLPQEILNHYQAMNAEVPLDEVDNNDAKRLSETATKLDTAITALQEEMKRITSPAKSSTDEDEEREKLFKLIKEALALQIADIGAIEIALSGLTSTQGKLDEEQKKDLQNLTPLNSEILLQLKKAMSIIEWWAKFTGDKLSEEQLLEINSKKALTEGSARTLVASLSALQSRIQELMTAAATPQPAPDTSSTSSRPAGTMSNSDDDADDEEDEEEEEEEEEEEKQQNTGSPLSLEEIVRLTNYYRKKCYLALHSQYDCINRKIIYQTYQNLQKSTADFCSQNKISKADFDKLSNNFLPKDAATVAKEKTELTKPQTSQPQEIFHFGTSCKLVELAQIEETVKSIIVDKNFAGDPNYAISSPPLKENGKARVTEMNFDGLKAASVERFRQEQNGKQSFISQSHLDRKVTDPKILMPWACSTINRFFAAAPLGTAKVKFEDGYSPQQFAALVSYCEFMGYPYIVGKMQKLRLIAASLLAANKLEPALHRRISRNLSVTLTAELEDLIQQDSRDWSQWVGPQQSGAFTTAKWQSWLDSAGVQEKYPAVPPLGKVRHDELLKKYDPTDPNLKPRTQASQPSVQLAKNSFLAKPKASTKKSARKDSADLADLADLELDLEAEDEEEAPFATLSKKTKITK